MKKGSIITIIPLKTYFIIIGIFLLIWIIAITSPIWYSKIRDLSFKLNPSNSGLTNINDILNNPLNYDGKTVTIQGKFNSLKTTWFDDYTSTAPIREGYNICIQSYNS